VEAEIQCVKCNSDLGSELVSQAKQDPVLRLAIRNLQNQLPDLYLSMEQGQRYYAKDVEGKGVPVKLRNGRYETEAHKREDGSLILDTKKGEKNMRQLLQKEGLSSAEIEQAILKFKEAPENTFVRLSSGRVAVKWGVVSFFPTLEKPEMSPRLVALIAYNFLCLLFDKDVLNPWFDFVRSFVRTGKPDDRLKIETFSSRKYEPYHRLYPEFGSEGAKINLVLFGWLIYHIELKGLLTNAPATVYIEDLENKRVLLAESVEHAKRGDFHSNKPIPDDGSGV
jgi:hypothetical protein